MLQFMHNTANSFFVKLLLALLVASFALWGIGDIFRSNSSTTVAEVGENIITAQEYRSELDRELAEYRRMLGSQYSPDLLKTLGVPQQVLSKIVERKLVEEEVRALGVVVPDSRLKEELRDNPVFHGEDGKFDAQQFKLILRNNGLDETYYLSLLEREIAADILIQSALSGVQVTDIAAQNAYLYENESRKVDVLVFAPSLVEGVAEPTDVELESYYEKNAENFRAAEHRIFSMLMLDPKTMAQDIAVSDEDVLIEYQSRIDSYRQPETRELKQLLFNDEESAQKAAMALAGGKTMEAAAKEFGATNETILLGSVTASGVLPEAEKVVFSLEEGAYSQPIQSSFGWHVFQVVDIQPERTRPLTEVKDELVTAIRNDRVGEEAYELSNMLQDDLAGGATLEEAAKGVDASVQVFGPISADGTSPDGTAITLPAGYENLLNDAFSLEEGQVSNLMETDEGSYYALRVDTVQPERTRALDEIKGQVIADWKEHRKGEALYQLASGISSTLAQEDAATVARTTGATLVTNQTVTRATTELNGKQMPAMMLSAIFAAQEGAATEAFALADGSYVVAKLDSVTKADTASSNGRSGIERARENLRVLYGDEFYQQYMAYLQKKHGVSEPNQALIDTLIR